MNLITLINDEQVTLATGKLIYAPEETGALRSAIETASALATSHASAQERINAAIEQGREQGMKEGYEAGLQQGRQQVSEQLVRLADQAQSHLEQQRNTTTQMALQIVRKVAGNFAPQETLAALAQVAAQECGANESITLRVHPDNCEQVQAQLAGSDQVQSGANQVTTVIADASLEENGCVLETRQGSVIADLETQLVAIENSLGPVPAEPD